MTYVPGIPTDAELLLNASTSGYGSLPDPQLVTDALSTGSTGDVASMLAAGNPNYATVASATPLGQPGTGKLPANVEALAGRATPHYQPAGANQYFQYGATSADQMGQINQEFQSLGDAPEATRNWYETLLGDSSPRSLAWQQYLHDNHFVDAFVTGPDGKVNQSAIPTPGKAWNLPYAQAMRSFLIARYSPYALYAGDSGTTDYFTSYLKSLGFDPQAAAKMSPDSNTFRNQVVQNWLSSQGPDTKQGDSINRFASYFGDANVPDQYNGFRDHWYDSIAAGIDTITHIPSTIVGLIPGVGSIAATPLTIGENLVSNLVNPVDLLENAKSGQLLNPLNVIKGPGELRAERASEGLDAYTKGLLAPAIQEMQNSSGFMSAFDAYSRTANRGLLTLELFLNHGVHGDWENPFDSNSNIRGLARQFDSSPFSLTLDQYLGDGYAAAHPWATNLGNFAMGMADDPTNWIPMVGEAKFGETAAGIARGAGDAAALKVIAEQAPELADRLRPLVTGGASALLPEIDRMLAAGEISPDAAAAARTAAETGSAAAKANQPNWFQANYLAGRTRMGGVIPTGIDAMLGSSSGRKVAGLLAHPLTQTINESVDAVRAAATDISAARFLGINNPAMLDGIRAARAAETPAEARGILFSEYPDAMWDPSRIINTHEYLTKLGPEAWESLNDGRRMRFITMMHQDDFHRQVSAKNEDVIESADKIERAMASHGVDVNDRRELVDQWVNAADPIDRHGIIAKVNKTSKMAWRDTLGRKELGIDSRSRLPQLDPETQTKVDLAGAPHLDKYEEMMSGGRGFVDRLTKEHSWSPTRDPKAKETGETSYLPASLRLLDKMKQMKVDPDLRDQAHLELSERVAAMVAEIQTHMHRLPALAQERWEEANPGKKWTGTAKQMAEAHQLVEGTPIHQEILDTHADHMKALDEELATTNWASPVFQDAKQSAHFVHLWGTSRDALTYSSPALRRYEMLVRKSHIQSANNLFKMLTLSKLSTTLKVVFSDEEMRILARLTESPAMMAEHMGQVLKAKFAKLKAGGPFGSTVRSEDGSLRSAALEGEEAPPAWLSNSGRAILRGTNVDTHRPIMPGEVQYVSAWLHEQGRAFDARQNEVSRLVADEYAKPGEWSAKREAARARVKEYLRGHTEEGAHPLADEDREILRNQARIAPPPLGMHPKGGKKLTKQQYADRLAAQATSDKLYAEWASLKERQHWEFYRPDRNAAAAGWMQNGVTEKQFRQYMKVHANDPGEYSLPVVNGRAPIMAGGGMLQRYADQYGEWWHEHVTGKMVTEARNRGYITLQKVHRQRLKQMRDRGGINWDDERIDRHAENYAHEWVTKNTYTGARSVFGSTMSATHPFWGATSSQNHWMYRFLSQHPAAIKPFLDLEQWSQQNSQNGGMHLTVPLVGRLLSAIGMTSGDELNINPAAAFFSTANGYGGMMPGLGPYASIPLRAVMQQNPDFANWYQSIPGNENAALSSPMFSWFEKLVDGVGLATAGKAPLENVPLLGYSSSYYEALERKKLQQQEGNMLEGGAAPPTLDSAKRDVGLSSALAGILGFFAPISAKVEDQRGLKYTQTRKVMDLAATDAQKVSVLESDPGSAAAFVYQAPQLAKLLPAAMLKELMGTQQLADAVVSGSLSADDIRRLMPILHPWVVPYTTSMTAPVGTGASAGSEPNMGRYQSDIASGSLAMLDPGQYLARIRTYEDYNAGWNKYDALHAAYLQKLASMNLNAQSPQAKALRDQFLQPGIEAIGQAHPQWFHQFNTMPNKTTQSGLSAATEPLSSVMSWEVIPRSPSMETQKSIAWRATLVRRDQAAGAIRQLQAQHASKAAITQVMEGLQASLAGLASQYPEFAAELSKFRFSSMQDLVKYEAGVPAPLDITSG